MYDKPYGALASGQPDYQAFVPPNPPLWSSTPLSVGQYVPVYRIGKQTRSFRSTTGENVIAQNMSHLTQDMLDLYGYDSVPLHGIAEGAPSAPYFPDAVPLFSSTPINISDYQPVWQSAALSPDDVINRVSRLPAMAPPRSLTWNKSKSDRFFGASVPSSRSSSRRTFTSARSQANKARTLDKRREKESEQRKALAKKVAEVAAAKAAAEAAQKAAFADRMAAEAAQKAQQASVAEANAAQILAAQIAATQAAQAVQAAAEAAIVAQATAAATKKAQREKSPSLPVTQFKMDVPLIQTAPAPSPVVISGDPAAPAAVFEAKYAEIVEGPDKPNMLIIAVGSVAALGAAVGLYIYIKNR